MLTKHKGMQLKMHCCTIEELMPQDHFLRDLDKVVDFDFVYDRVAHLYSTVGRPSIDPVIVVKILLLGYLYDIFSERKIMGEIQVNIAYRWFLGMDLDEPVPDHSTLSQLRRRKFNDSRLFEDVFDEIVKKCIKVGLVDGELLLTDSTHVRANAANGKRETISVKQEPTAYMKKLDEMALAEGLIKEVSKPSGKTVEQVKSLTDPYCGLMNRPGKPKGFHYLSHQTVDGNRGIITDVFVTPGNVCDCVPHAERLKYQMEKFGFRTKEVGADAGYDVPEIHAEMFKLGIKTYIPEIEWHNQYVEQSYCVDAFTYDASNDIYICPNNCLLRYRYFKKGQGQKVYCSRTSDCSACPRHTKCIPGKMRYKRVVRPYQKTEYDLQHENNETHRFQEVMRLRKIWCEGTFAHQKARHCLTRAKMRGIVQITGQCRLSACAINLKRLLNWIKGNSKSFVALLLDYCFRYWPISPSYFAFCQLYDSFYPFCQQPRMIR